MYIPYQIDFIQPAQHSIPKNDNGKSPEKPDLEVQISMRLSGDMAGSEENRRAAIISAFFDVDKHLVYEEPEEEDPEDEDPEDEDPEDDKTKKNRRL